MAQKKPKPRKLGRGLDALLNAKPVAVVAPEPDAPPTGTESAVGGHASPTSAAEPTDADHRAAVSEASQTVWIAVDEITPSPFQPRRSFAEDELAQLADSIRDHGLLQPIIVRTTSAVGFELIAGERRWRAAQRAGLGRVPAIVRSCTDDDAAALALIENLQRSDLNPLERATALRALGERFELTHQEIADRVTLDRATVTNLIRITELEEPILNDLAAGRLTTGHAKALLSAPAGDVRVRLASAVVEQGWTVRKTEEEARGAARGGGPAATGRDGDRRNNTRTGSERNPDLVMLERQLTEHLGAKVEIRTTRDGSSGQLRIAFSGLDHFDGVLDKLGFRID